MELLKLISVVIALISFVMSACFAISAWFNLREQRRDIRRLQFEQVRIFAMISAVKLQGDFDQLLQLKNKMADYLEREQYEKAQHLKELIAQQEERTRIAIQLFNERFGDIAGVSVEKVEL